jgi:hypothetical protein
MKRRKINISILFLFTTRKKNTRKKGKEDERMCRKAIQIQNVEPELFRKYT